MNRVLSPAQVFPLFHEASEDGMEVRWYQQHPDGRRTVCISNIDNHQHRITGSVQKLCRGGCGGCIDGLPLGKTFDPATDNLSANEITHPIAVAHNARMQLGHADLFNEVIFESRSTGESTDNPDEVVKAVELMLQFDTPRINKIIINIVGLTRYNSLVERLAILAEQDPLSLKNRGLGFRHRVEFAHSTYDMRPESRREHAPSIPFDRQIEWLLRFNEICGDPVTLRVPLSGGKTKDAKLKTCDPENIRAIARFVKQHITSFTVELTSYHADTGGPRSGEIFPATEQEITRSWQILRQELPDDFVTTAFYDSKIEAGCGRNGFKPGDVVQIDDLKA